MNDAFHLELLDQGSLIPSDSEGDLCSHGHLRLTIGGVELIGGKESYGISESALAMLRTLDADHTTTGRVAERMIFHGCGNFLMMGCPIGADFNVRHNAGLVHIDAAVRYETTNGAEGTRFPDLQVVLSEAEYRAQVVEFAVRARELFVGSVKRFSEFSTQHSTEISGPSTPILAKYGSD